MPSYTISNDYGYIYLDILKKKKNYNSKTTFCAVHGLTEA